MKLYAFVVRDSASQAFGTPIFLPAVCMAVRSFADEVNREASDNQLFLHSSDFVLYQVGVFETDTGLFVNEPEGPRQLSRGVDVRLK